MEKEVAVDLRKLLKSLVCTLQDKFSELKGMDDKVLEYMDDSKIEEDMSESWDFARAIRSYIVDLETAINQEKQSQ